MAGRPPVLPRLGRARDRARKLDCGRARLHRGVVAGRGPGPRYRQIHRQGRATLYVRTSDGRFERQQNSSAGSQSAASSVLDADEPLAVALRAGRSVARCDEVHSTLPGELVMVLSRQRELEAFILIGRRNDGCVLRSDEVAALRATLQSVGVEWQALRWEALQRERVRA